MEADTEMRGERGCDEEKWRSTEADQRRLMLVSWREEKAWEEAAWARGGVEREACGGWGRLCENERKLSCSGGLSPFEVCLQRKGMPMRWPVQAITTCEVVPEGSVWENGGCVCWRWCRPHLVIVTGDEWVEVMGGGCLVGGRWEIRYWCSAVQEERGCWVGRRREACRRWVWEMPACRGLPGGPWALCHSGDLEIALEGCSSAGGGWLEAGDLCWRLEVFSLQEDTLVPALPASACILLTWAGMLCWRLIFILQCEIAQCERGVERENTCLVCWENGKAERLLQEDCDLLWYLAACYYLYDAPVMVLERTTENDGRWWLQWLLVEAGGGWEILGGGSDLDAVTCAAWRMPGMLLLLMEGGGVWYSLQWSNYNDIWYWPEEEIIEKYYDMREEEEEVMTEEEERRPACSTWRSGLTIIEWWRKWWPPILPGHEDILWWWENVRESEREYDIGDL